MRSFRPRRGYIPRKNNGHKLVKALRTQGAIEQFIEEARELTPEAAMESKVTAVFSDYSLPSSVQAAITTCGYRIPTPIQDQVIPVVLTGKDVIGIANTGTGKTASFLIPLITRILTHTLHKVIILAPTHELALQIKDDFYHLSKDSGLKAVLCIGGTSLRQQINNLSRPYNFLIGTPGRITDMVNQRQISLPTFDGVVLDEVDRMLDMGFIKDVRGILDKLPHKRQSLFFSATLPPDVETLCSTFANKPTLISIRTTEYAQSVEQHLVRLKEGQKKAEFLFALLRNQHEFKKVLIFGRTKHGVKRLARDLEVRGFAVDSIHGNKTQAARQRSLQLFKSQKISILVATDVAARGIDVTDISHVINYDMPETVEDYIHRIGRTGRAGQAGKAITFMV